MKKRIIAFAIASLVLLGAGMNSAQAYYWGRRGRGYGFGSFWGGLTGGLIGGSITKKDTSGMSRAEIEAQRAQDKAEQLQREQASAQMAQLRRDMEQRKSQIMQDEQQMQYLMMQQHAGRRGQSPMNMVLILFLVMTIFGVAGMAFMLFRKKKE